MGEIIALKLLHSFFHSENTYYTPTCQGIVVKNENEMTSDIDGISVVMGFILQDHYRSF
jgi:hypothetical protein